MIKYIYETCKNHNCTVDLYIGPDGAMSITVFGKCKDYVVIGADWSEEIIKECIKDTVRRACDE